MLLLATSAKADSLLCLQAVRYYEKVYHIPTGLLQAIAVVESGRFADNDQKLMPWPWAVNMAGKPYYFPDKRLAMEFVRDQLAMGRNNIDVGCNQISLLHHGDKFASLEAAFNPYDNARYAAIFLREKYQETGNWLHAAGWYHSKTAQHAIDYIDKIKKLWVRTRKNSHLRQPLSKAQSHRTAMLSKFQGRHNNNAGRLNQRNQPIIVFQKSAGDT